MPGTGAHAHELWMTRFTGLEKYRIESAKWNLYQDESSGRMNLWLEVRCADAIAQAEDTAFLDGRPNWEINLVEDSLSESDLVDGFETTIPECYDESRDGWITNFYFCEHHGSDDNTIVVMARDGERLLIRLTGEIDDVSYYDGSKPRSKLLVETWFDRDRRGGRSMA